MATITIRYVSEFVKLDDNVDLDQLAAHINKAVKEVAQPGTVRFVIKEVSREEAPAPAAAPLSGTVRANIHIGATVDIVLKADQPTGKLTRGVVARILTKSPEHHRGIKVMLTDGQVGRVQHILG